MVLSPKIEVRVSGISGHGLYAKEKILKGEMVWEAEPDEETFWYTKEQVAQWSEEDQKRFWNFAYQVKEGVWGGIPPGRESDKGEYMNHSCNGNTEYRGDKLVIAFRDIEVGEEVTYDYGQTETDDSMHMPFRCLCGTAACRGVVTGYDGLRPSLRAKYAGGFADIMTRFQEAFDGGKVAVPEAYQWVLRDELRDSVEGLPKTAAEH